MKKVRILKDIIGHNDVETANGVITETQPTNFKEDEITSIGDQLFEAFVALGAVELVDADDEEPAGDTGEDNKAKDATPTAPSPAATKPAATKPAATKPAGAAKTGKK